MHDIANTDMAEAWDGHEGEHWARHQQRYDRSLTPHLRRLIEAAAPAPDAVVLDIGCGNGASTRSAARAARSGRAHGVDLSSQMLDTARRLSAAENLSNVSFEQGDAQVHPFGNEYDLVISQFGTMFFADPVAAFENIASALRPGGRLTMLTWRPLLENPWMLTILGSLAAGRELPVPPPEAPGLFSLSDPKRVRDVLDGAGFDQIELVEVDEPVHLGDDPDDALGFLMEVSVVKGMLADLDTSATAAALDELRHALDASTGPEGIELGSAAWLTTACSAR